MEYDWPTLDTLCIAAVDVERNWPACEAALVDILEHFDGRDEAAITRLGDDLLKCSFFTDVSLGERVVDLLLARGGLRDPRWTACTRKVLAGMLTRDPDALEQTFERHGVRPRLVEEIRQEANPRLVEERDKFIYQIGWNRAINTAMVSNPTLRYLILKELVAGLARSGSSAEWSVYFRRFVVGVITAYFGDERVQDPARYRRLSLQDAMGDAAR
jgi:hypothetical protein